jgi:hypothetical protein
MRVRFLDDYDYKPSDQVTIGYEKGMQVLVKQDCADQAIAAGKAEEVPAKMTKTKSEEPEVAPSDARQ